MAKTISVTLPEGLYARIEAARRAKGAKRSELVQEALTYYLELQGPDPEIIRRWEKAYSKLGAREVKSAAEWRPAQSGALGKP